MANVFDPTFDHEQDEPPYRWRRARIGKQAGMEQLGASLFEVPPGATTFPLHVHYNNEEAMVVLSGRPTLRSVDGSERVLEPGEVVACPVGRRGGHRLDNRSDEPVRVLIFSTMNAPEINELPETGEFWVRSYVPGTEPTGEPDELDVHLWPKGPAA